MLGDQNHEETCYGNLSLDGESYDMSIKGRGNSSWTFNFDKKPFILHFIRMKMYQRKSQNTAIRKKRN